jgi:hypothetical protein
MATVLSSKSYLINTDIGMMRVTLQTVEDYDVDDLVHDAAMSQATVLRFIAQGSKVDVNAEIHPKAIRSAFYNNTEELPT